jgi:hypothetical protein
MISLEDFRTGKFCLPFSCADEIPECCFACVYLLYGETDVSMGDAPYFYFCGYTWPDKLTQTIPPCLA